MYSIRSAKKSYFLLLWNWVELLHHVLYTAVLVWWFAYLLTEKVPFEVVSTALHEERPDLVEKYTAFLEEQFVAHRELGTQFTPGTETALTPEQLRSLRALGYIQ